MQLSLGTHVRNCIWIGVITWHVFAPFLVEGMQTLPWIAISWLTAVLIVIGLYHYIERSAEKFRAERDERLRRDHPHLFENY